MTAEYRIDISKNTITNTISAKRALAIYMYGFLFVGVFYVIYTIIKKDSWEHYPIGLTAFFWSFFLYLRMKEKWIYARYFSISSEKIKWQQDSFSRAGFEWTAIKDINFTNANINFRLATNIVKRFSLANITALQITELKNRLSQLAAEKGITFNTN